MPLPDPVPHEPIVFDGKELTAKEERVYRRIARAATLLAAEELKNGRPEISAAFLRFAALITPPQKPPSLRPKLPPHPAPDR